MLFSTLLEIIPVLIAAVIIEYKRFGRKNSLLIFYACTAVFSLFVFLNRKNFIYYVTACKLFLNMTAVFCLQYTCEIYHTKNRATGAFFILFVYFIY